MSGLVVLLAVGEADKPAVLALPAAAVALGLLMAAQFLRLIQNIRRKKNLVARGFCNVASLPEIGPDMAAPCPKNIPYLSLNATAKLYSSDELWPAPCSFDGLPRFHQGNCCHGMCSAINVSPSKHMNAATATGSKLTTLLLTSDSLTEEFGAPGVHCCVSVIGETTGTNNNQDTFMKTQAATKCSGMFASPIC